MNLCPGALFSIELKIASYIILMIVSGNSFLILTCHQTHSNLIFLKRFLNLRPLTQFYANIRAISLQRSTKTCLAS